MPPMPFTVKYGDGVTIEAPTADDLEAVLSVIDRRRSGGVHIKEAPQGTVSDRMLKLIEQLSERHVMLLYALSGAPAGLDDNGLMARMGFRSRRNIGALLMGITKKARKLGLDMDKQVVCKRVDRSVDGERTYTYRIRDDAINALAASQTPGQHSHHFENGEVLTMKVGKSFDNPFEAAQKS
jgi:hypothetical protein